MSPPKLDFKRLRRDDLTRMLRWHDEPHVKRWYDRDKDMTSLAAIGEEYGPLLGRPDPPAAQSS